ncbi:hypothetical protein GGF43_000623 [Coemansia sp. RSA 2618]|nr:hypothetical protein GGF43_000623 [Coemansia sp. RSA 2618]
MDGFGYQLAADAAEAEGCAPARSSSSTPPNDTLDTAFSSMFGYAAQWGKKLQSELQLDDFVDQLKKQSTEVTKAYSQDLAEFAQAVKTGATRGMDTLSTRLTQLRELDEPQGLRAQQERARRVLGRLGSDLEDLLREAIVIEAPGSGSTEEQREQARKIIYDRRMAQLAHMRESEVTYTEDPKDEEYARFAAEFSVDGRKEEIAGLLLEPSVADMHGKLVPEQVSESVFWARYFFHAWTVEQEEIRRKKLVEAAVAATAEDEFSWDMDDDDEQKPSHEAPAAVGADSTKDEDAKPEKDESSSNADDVTSGEDKSKADNKAKVDEKTSDKTKTDDKTKADDEIKTNDKVSEAANPTKDSKPNDDDDGWDEWE